MTSSPRILERPSPNHDARTPGVPVDILVLHYTGMTSAQAAIDRLTDPAAKVSAHYTVDDDGTVYAHVDEARRAWHAGVSHWAGASDINARSIGIEIVNPGHEFGYVDFSHKQIEAVIALSLGVVARHAIPAARVLAHSDVAPARKQDPGEKFPWQELAHRGIGLWSSAHGGNEPFLREGDAGAEVADLQTRLARFGYGLSPTGTFDSATALVVTAFQRHYRPHLLDGQADAQTQARLSNILEMARL